MAPIITSKAAVREIIIDLLSQHAPLEAGFIDALRERLLTQKVKFPVLEFASGLLYKEIPEEKIIFFTDEAVAKNETGSYVIAGKMLQLHLPYHFSECIVAAKRYIVTGDAWYVCDIIGERVFGHGMLVQPEKMLPVLSAMRNEHSWLVRAIGVATHYAVKKKLDKGYAEKLFTLLLSLSDTTDFHTKKGIGWGAKTIAKFHPDIISLYKDRIADTTQTRPWFRSKVTIGLGRSWKYATSN